MRRRPLASLGMAVMSPPPEPVAVLGASGALGSGLTMRLAAAGVQVLIGSRRIERAQATAERIAAQMPAGSTEPVPHTNADAIAGAEVAFLCIPFRNHSETFTSIRHLLRDGQILVDSSVPLAATIDGKATRTIGIWQGSAAQQADEMTPSGVRIVAGLHTVSAKPLRDLDHELDQDVLLCGDERADKLRVASILQRIHGLRCVDAGRLEQARIVEQLTATLIGINATHRVHAGLRITGLPDELCWPELAATTETV